MNLPLTPQERQVIEEAFGPYLQAVTIVAKLRGLNPAAAQLSGDRSCFIIADQPSRLTGEATVESNSIQTHG